MTDYLFPPMVALTADGVVLRSGVGQVYAEADTGYTSPLTVYSLGGVSMTDVEIDSLGVTAAFRHTAGIVIWKSGANVLTIWSATGMLDAATASVGSAAASAAAAIAAQGAAEAAAVDSGSVSLTSYADQIADLVDYPATFPPAAHTHIAAGISDATALGRNVLKATDALAARTLIAAGTSSLILGSGGTAAKAGNWKPAIADLPAGSVIFSVSATVRGSARTDIVCIFLTATDPVSARLTGDLWLRTT